MTVTEAARRFSDLINRVRYQNESTLLLKGGQPVARVVPVMRACTGTDLAASWATMPHLDHDEATSFAHDLAEARKRMAAPVSPWD